MASFARPIICPNRHEAVKQMDISPPPAATALKRPRRVPVRVRLQHVSTEYAKTRPWDGEGSIWWTRLKQALGTTSSDFVNASLIQLQRAAQLPSGGISEMALNSALAMIEAAAPRDEMEAALAIQMACTHAAAMSVLARLGGGHGSERRVIALGSAAARLLRAYSAQVEVFRRLRHGGQQLVRVEHVHINEGGQAIIGNVGADRSGASGSPERDLQVMTPPAGA